MGVEKPKRKAINIECLDSLRACSRIMDTEDRDDRIFFNKYWFRRPKVAEYDEMEMTLKGLGRKKAWPRWFDNGILAA